MERICEPELMDDAEQARSYADADFAAGDRALLKRTEGLFGPQLGPRIIDLGCGPGNISFLLAERYPTARVLGLDGAPAMLAIAAARLQATPDRWPGLSFQHLLLTPGGALPQEGRWTAVVSNSLLHHLHDPLVLWQAVRRLAAPGAAICIKDLHRPSDPAALEELVQRHAAGAPPVLRRDYAQSLRAAFRRVEVEAQLQQAGIEGLAVRELDDRYLEVWGRLA
jgi:trans-aconitate 2-methyltransferase